MLKGSDIVVKCLEQAGVELVFAYPGTTIMDLLHSLLDSSIRVIQPVHEQGGAFMAGGYARRTGKTGVCMSTSGPGATNLVTGITDAYMDSIPTVFICCQVPHSLIGRNAFQETDIIGMTRPCVKHSYLVLSPEEIPGVIADAFHLASHGRPGPIVIDIPLDILKAKCDVIPTVPPSNRCLSLPEDISPKSLQEFFACLSSSRKPCIIAGGGVIHSGASDILLEFAEKYRIPVSTSLMGLGCFPQKHPLSLGLSGMHGNYTANRAIQDCDLLIAVCIRFSNRVTGDISSFAPGARIVHIDIDPSEINKNKRCDWSFVGNTSDILRLFLECPGRPDSSAWLKRLDSLKGKYPVVIPPVKDRFIRPQRLLAALSRLTHGQATIVTGVGQHQMWTAQFYEFSQCRQLLTSGGLGAMGFGLPAAIGAILADPRQPTILIDGDGSFQMNIQELATLFLYGLPLKMIIINNQCLGMIRQLEQRFFNGVIYSESLPKPENIYPDFCAIVHSYGIPARRISRAAEINDALTELLDSPGAMLLEVLVSSDEQVLPMIPPGQNCDSVILPDSQTIA